MASDKAGHLESLCQGPLFASSSDMSSKVLRETSEPLGPQGNSGEEWWGLQGCIQKSLPLPKGKPRTGGWHRSLSPCSSPLQSPPPRGEE